MMPLMDRNGVDVLLPHDAGIGAERVRPGDPRYDSLRAQAVDLNVPADPAADALLQAEFEARFRAAHHAA